MRRTRFRSASNPKSGSGELTQHDAVCGSEITGNFAEYIEQSGKTLERQRMGFDNERAAVAEERKLWRKERAMMQQRITELERRLGTPAGQDRQTSSSQRSSVCRLSRSMPSSMQVLPSEPSRSGLEPAALADPSFLRSHVADRAAFIKEPVRQVDSTSDGVTSTGPRPGVLGRNRPPSFSRDTSNVQPIADPCGHRQSSQPTSSPSHENGDAAKHTPVLATDSSLTSSSQAQNPNVLSEEPPLAPRHTREAFETASSNSSHLDEDPALQGPLTLQNDKTLDDDFLHKLDQKLSYEAQRPIFDKTPSGSEFPNDDLELELIPGVRLKKTATNFGTPFGSSRVGIR